MCRFMHASLLSVLVLVAATRLAQAQGDVGELNSRADKLFAAYDKPDSPGCALAVIKDGTVLHKRGFGRANLETDAPITPGTVFHVASVSKQFTAFAILLLAKDGKLSLDDDVRKHIPELADFGKTVTIRHLIHHTSGLRDQWRLLKMAGWRMEDVITERDILDLVFRQKELNFAPGAEYLYSNTGYTLLAVIVARVSKQSFREFTQERIFKPLAMTSTHFHDDHRQIVKNRAYSYRPARRGAEFELVPLQYANVGATSLFTTVEDLTKWDRNFYDAKVGAVGKSSMRCTARAS
jgi:CubicO group peptidase (beta-lactamase class C family)